MIQINTKTFVPCSALALFPERISLINMVCMCLEEPSLCTYVDMGTNGNYKYLWSFKNACICTYVGRYKLYSVYSFVNLF